MILNGTIEISFVVVYVYNSTPEFNKNDSPPLITKAPFLQRRRLESKADCPI